MRGVTSAPGVRVAWNDTDSHDFLSRFLGEKDVDVEGDARGVGPTSRVVGSIWRALGLIRLHCIEGCFEASLRAESGPG